jgi:branched-chain amino acid transport system permease protein
LSPGSCWTFGINYWAALVLAPLLVGGGASMVTAVPQTPLQLDEIYGLLLTFGLTLIAEGIFRELYGVSGQNYPVPELPQGATDLGFMILPNYRACGGGLLPSVAWDPGTPSNALRLGAHLRAGTENANWSRVSGINVPMMSLTYGAGAAPALPVFCSTHHPGHTADGLQSDHCGVRRGGDWRMWVRFASVITGSRWGSPMS